jgi:hypothetical protein
MVRITPHILTTLLMTNPGKAGPFVGSQQTRRDKQVRHGRIFALT